MDENLSKPSLSEEKVRSGHKIRVVVSIIIVFAWLIYAIIQVAFLWGRFSTIQNITLMGITFLLGVAINAVMWASWGSNICKEYCECIEKIEDLKTE